MTPHDTVEFIGGAVFQHIADLVVSRSLPLKIRLHVSFVQRGKRFGENCPELDDHTVFRKRHQRGMKVDFRFAILHRRTRHPGDFTECRDPFRRLMRINEIRHSYLQCHTHLNQLLAILFLKQIRFRQFSHSFKSARSFHYHTALFPRFH